MKKKGFTLVELLVVVLIVLMLIGIAVGGIGGCSQSDGSRIGQISKFSYKGVIWKTYEGEMICGGLRQKIDAGSVANIWEFSLDNADNPKEMADILQKAMDKGEPVKITYKQKFFVWPWRAETNYLVQKVEPIKKEEE